MPAKSSFSRLSCLERSKYYGFERQCGMEKKCCERAMKKIEKVIELLNDLNKNEFTGFIRINYSQGGITRIEKNEEILKKTQAQK